MAQLDNLIALAESGVEFSFISEKEVGTRVAGVQLADTVAAMLDPAQQLHLKQQIVTFRNAEAKTRDPVVALALLHPPAWLNVKPGDWVLPQEPVEPPKAQAVDVPVPEPEPVKEAMPNSTPKRRAKKR